VGSRGFTWDQGRRRVQAFLEQPPEGEWPYLWLDATYLKQREGGRIVSVAAIVAVAVSTGGGREIIGLKVGPCEGATREHAVSLRWQVVCQSRGGSQLLRLQSPESSSKERNFETLIRIVLATLPIVRSSLTIRVELVLSDIYHCQHDTNETGAVRRQSTDYLARSDGIGMPPSCGDDEMLAKAANGLCLGQGQHWRAVHDDDVVAAAQLRPQRRERS
jgi:hypothetical protein